MPISRIAPIPKIALRVDGGANTSDTIVTNPKSSDETIKRNSVFGGSCSAVFLVDI
jgi:hypothetical protein